MKSKQAERMSKDDSEVQALKQVVIAALEQRGILAKVKADVRASVFTIIQEQQKKRESVPADPKPKLDFLKVSENKLSSEVFIEFLQHHGFAHTLAVFLAEINLPTQAIPSKEKVASSLNLPATKEPVINQMISNIKNGNQTGKPTTSAPSSSPAPSPVATTTSSTTENAPSHPLRVNPLLNKIPSKSPTQSPTGADSKAVDPKSTTEFQKPKPVLAPLSVKGLDGASPKKELSPINGLSTSNKPLDFLNRKPLESVRSPSNQSPLGSRSQTGSPHSTISVSHSTKDDDETSVSEEIEEATKSHDSSKEDGYSTDDYAVDSESTFRHKPDYEEAFAGA